MFFVYRLELAPGIISLTGDWSQANNSKQYAYSVFILSLHDINICFGGVYLFAR